METGQAFLPDLLETIPAAPKGEKEKAGSKPLNLIDALAGGEESFLTTLLGREGDQNFLKSGSPAVLTSFLSETKNTGITLTTLLDSPRNNLPLFSESASVPAPGFQNSGVAPEKSGEGVADIVKSLSNFKEFNTDPVNMEKVQQYNTQDAKTAAHTSEGKSTDTSLNSESGLKQGEDSKLKAADTAPGITATNKNYGAGSPGIRRTFQASETEIGNVKVSLEKGVGLQKEPPLNPEQGEKDRFPNFVNKEMANSAINQDSGHKNLDIKIGVRNREMFDPGMIGNKVVKIDLATGEDAFLSSNNQTAEKTFESLIQAKETHTVQKPLQSDVMSQLVEKAVLNLKNGQTSIRISLKPETLGHLRMHITTENNQVMIKILTEIPLVKEIIETNVNQLRAELQNQGLEIDKFDVSVDHGSNKNKGTENLPFRKTADDKTEGDITEENKEIILLREVGESENHIDFFA